jgi:hypothetical protein
MDPYIQTILGIIASIVLFLFGYRKTIGARGERIRAANNKFIELVLRRIIIDGYKLDKNEILKIIEGGAMELNLRLKDILTVDQILKIVYAKIFENDFIAQEKRQNALNDLNNIFREEKGQGKQYVDMLYAAQQTISSANKISRKLSVAILGISSAVLGVFLVAPNKFNEQNLQTGNEMIIAIIASFVAVAAAYVFVKYRDSQDLTEDKTKDLYSDAISFEKDVIKSLKNSNLRVEIKAGYGPDYSYDLLIIKDNKKIAVELLSRVSKMPVSSFARKAALLQSVVERIHADEGIMVTKDKIDFPEELIATKNVKILSLNEFKKYVNVK